MSVGAEECLDKDIDWQRFPVLGSLGNILLLFNVRCTSDTWVVNFSLCCTVVESAIDPRDAGREIVLALDLVNMLCTVGIIWCLASNAQA